MDDWRVTVPPGPPVETGAGLTATGAGGGGIMFSTGRAVAELIKCYFNNTPLRWSK